MPTARPIRGKSSWRVAGLALALVGADGLAAPPGSATPPARSGIARFDLPDAWEERFWTQPGVRALLTKDAKALAALVPSQAGLRFCRCPTCPADEVDDPLAWSPEQPEFLTCRRCGARFPNDKIPAKVIVKNALKKDEERIPEEEVEVLPGVVHRYPYHAVEPDRQRYPDERIYLAAKRDYEAREFLAKVALYAAVRSREQPAGTNDPALARLAGVLVLRFAQVYPAYATHYDQPGQPKFFQRADLPPPYRLGYRTAKWDWSGALDVPVNLLIAYALIRDDPALAEAGRQLGDPHPGRTIERDLFRAAAEFVRHQPETVDETSLYADRGMLAVGRLLGDAELVRAARARLDEFARRSFYHDGLWRQADARAHHRVLGLVDGWIDPLLAGAANLPGAGDEGLDSLRVLARSAAGASLTDPRAPEVQQASWPAPAPRGGSRRPILLGGAGLARRAVGAGADALDLELHGFGSLGGPRFDRLALRLAVGGRLALGDLDDLPPSAGGFERSTVSHNAVVVDGLNQRETTGLARQGAPGADILFFAADPDFQVATFDDRQAFPRSAGLYRHTVVAAAGPGGCYAVSLFEVRGGLQHDQLFHAPAGSAARWRTPLPLAPGPRSLLPVSVAYLPTARAEDGRWFLQSFGALAGLAQGRADRPFLAWLEGPGAPPLRVHFLTGVPLTVVTGTSPDPTAPTPGDADEPGRGALVLRRRSSDGSSLDTTFVTVFEPRGPRPGIGRVGRLESPPGTVVLLLETAGGTEHLVVNFAPGTRQTVRLADGTPLETDGLAVRETAAGLVLAGGTFAASAGRVVRQPRAEGTIRRAVRAAEGDARGWFEAAEGLPAPETLAGRALLVRHGDGTTRGWTLVRAENTPDGRARLLVREELGFQIDPERHDAVYYQFPGTRAPGPHRFRVAQIAR